MAGMRTTGVVVIGGGCIGLASAIALAGRGTKVTLVERGLPGAANSTLTGGGIRQQFGTELNVRLSQLSAEIWDEFAERYGVDPLFRPIGYLFLARTAEEAATLAAHVRLQNSLGVDSELLDGDEIAGRWPALSGRGFRAAGFRAADGWANQHRIVDGFVRGAIAAGVELLAGTEALALELSGRRVAGVTTTAGRIAADAVLVATGPWVKPLLEPLGIAVPILGRRHELLIVEPAEPLPPGLPWLIGVGDAVHVRSDTEGRALVGGFLGEDRTVDPDRYDGHADDRWTHAVLETAERDFGVVGPDALVRHGWAGLYPGTPDRHPIIDQLAEGLFAALGFSGTGVMHAPAAGLLSAELIADGAIRSVDGRPLSASRFGDENLSAEPTGF
jgi:glycine/D-amino acid oxidase-like deaminating enzyme